MISEYKLIGLNQAWKAGGFNSVYATVDDGNNGWFHAPFEPRMFSDERLNEIFDMFKNSEESLWSGRNHRVVIDMSVETRTEGQYGIITNLILDLKPVAK